MDLRGFDKKVAALLIAVVFVLSLAVPVYTYYNKIRQNGGVKNTVDELASSIDLGSVEETTTTETTEEITKDPPKKGPGGSSKTTKNNDGSKTIVVSDGSSPGELPDGSPGNGSVSGIKFVDETGQNGALESVIKNFMASNLRYSGEIVYLYQVTVRNAGATGWEGQWAGSYTQSANGDIISAFGYITLNTYYHQTSPYFNDYMKLVFSHEYGHHYSMYHKWVDLDLAFGVRFPNEYYNVRPLPKNTTAPDYSLGWANCDAEVVAEDYSYFYSGYGYHAMSGTYGYPSGGTKTWLINLANGGTSPAPAPVTDNPPVVSITEPSSGQTIAGVVYIKVNASDDHGLTKVSFFINGSLLAEDTSSPYEYSLSTTGYPNGSYILKATAYDSSQSADSSVSVNIVNSTSDTENPAVTITEPTPSPYAWQSSEPNLLIKVRTTDNVGVIRIIIFINDVQVLDASSSQVNATWAYSNAPAGTYSLKAQVFDAAGNSATATITINKT